jgi:hypothetical protein
MLEGELRKGRLLSILYIVAIFLEVAVDLSRR